MNQAVGNGAERVWTDVVAAVLYHSDGRYLLAQRPPGKAYAGYWEFPGGKVEPGESLDAALKREIREELGIDVHVACPWLVRTHVYEHAAVRLHFFRIREWSGTPKGLEGQQFAFQEAGAETVTPMLPANGPILKAVGLPLQYGITHAAELGVNESLIRLEAALTKGLRLVQVREKEMTGAARLQFAREVVARCHAHGARVLINDDTSCAVAASADGVHLSSRTLMTLPERPDFDLVGASVHTRVELEQAMRLGCDFAVLGPVMQTASHPGAPALGWPGFASVVREAAIPVYGIGGLQKADIYPASWTAGAHGVATLRATWIGSSA